MTCCVHVNQVLCVGYEINVCIMLFMGQLLHTLSMFIVTHIIIIFNANYDIAVDYYIYVCALRYVCIMPYVLFITSYLSNILYVHVSLCVHNLLHNFVLHKGIMNCKMYLCKALLSVYQFYCLYLCWRD